MSEALTSAPARISLSALRVSSAAVICCLTLSALGCGTGEASGGGERGNESTGSLLVLGASDLLAAFDELVPLYESRTGERVELVLGSTGNLSAQIRHGAPADLFFSANAAFLDGLIDAGRIDPGSRSIYAVGRLAAVAPPGSDPPAHPSELRDPRFRTIAIANPEHAPYGWAAREALRSLGLWEELRERIVMGENVAHALQFVRTGNADAGIVALSLVRGEFGESVPHRVVDDALHPPMLQVAGIVSGSNRPGQARAFLEFVLSPDGQEILARYGFEPPPSEVAASPGAAAPLSSHDGRVQRN